MKTLQKSGLFVLFSFLFSSCGLFLLVADPTPPDELISSLAISSDWRGNLIGQTIVEGTVWNNHHREVRNVYLRATAYNRSGQVVEQKELYIPVTITPNGSATFKEHMGTRRKNLSDVVVEVTSASD